MRPNKAKVQLDSLQLDSIAAVVSFLCYMGAHRLIHLLPLNIHVAAAILALVTSRHIWACLRFFKLVCGMAKLAQSWTLDYNIAVLSLIMLIIRRIVVHFRG